MTYISEGRKLGGSDARAIMRGEWRALWLVKTGRRPDEELSDVFRVQLGKFTEPFNLAWYAKTTGARMYDREPELLVHPAFPFMTAQLDHRSIRDGEARIVEAKHTNERSSPAKIAEEYFPQAQHYLAVTNYRYLDFSVIFGNKQHLVVPIERDEDYQADLVVKEEEFWSYVERDIEPKDQISQSAKAASQAVNLTRYDATKLPAANQFAIEAGRWITSKQAAADFEDATEELKKFCPKDASFVSGFGVDISCSRNGAKRISVSGSATDEEDQAA